MAVAVVFSSATVAVRFSARSSRPLAAAFSGSGGGEQRQLVLYTKPGCCLCDGLKEKLHAALYLDGPSSIHLQVRDITTNPEWEKLYQYEIPVLAKIGPDGTEETLPRLSPRLRVELIQKKIAAAFEQ